MEDLENARVIMLSLLYLHERTDYVIALLEDDEEEEDTEADG
jgi:hypothetical protein